jgi:hypothetical protein
VIASGLPWWGEKIAERTWQRTYSPYLLKLEQVAGAQSLPDDAPLLTAALRHWEPNSRARQMAHFPNDAAITRLVRAVLLEQHEHWELEGRRMI